jgi:hypothetical protein
VAEPLEKLLEVLARRLEPDDALSPAGIADDDSLEPSGFDDQSLARLDFLAGANKRAPGERLNFVDQEDLDVAAAVSADHLTSRIKSGGNYAAVVEDEQVGGTKEFADFAKTTMLQPARCSFDDEKARLVAPLGGMARDSIGREDIVKIFEPEHSGFKNVWRWMQSPETYPPIMEGAQVWRSRALWFFAAALSRRL